MWSDNTCNSTQSTLYIDLLPGSMPAAIPYVFTCILLGVFHSGNKIAYKKKTLKKLNDMKCGVLAGTVSVQGHHKQLHGNVGKDGCRSAQQLY